MRKQTKLVAVLSAAALLAIGASMTSFAATGWVEEGGTWVYYEKNGDKATEKWKKSGDFWFWLDDGGEMAIAQLLEIDDNYYYVGEDGAMVVNQWVAVDNEDAGEDDEPDQYWYYFQNNGKAYKRSDSASDTAISSKVINGKKYAFDTDGKMLYGWVKDGERQTDDDAWKEADYYFGDENDGSMSIGWRQVQITDDDFESAQPGDEYWDEEQDRWFYFQTSGKKKKASAPTDSNSKSYAEKTINGAKYGFDEYGRMISSWYANDIVATTNKATNSTASNGQGGGEYSKEFLYFNSPESGARYTKGWFKVVPGYYLHEAKYNDGDEYWYYADGNGKIYANEIQTIKSKKYAFDNFGRMINGLVFLEMANGTTSNEIVQKFADDGDVPYDTEDAFDEFVNTYGTEINDHVIRSYYFGSSDDGSMKTGRQTVTIDGDAFTFKFKTGSNLKGAGLMEVDDDKLYMAGKQVKADKDDKYSIYEYDVNKKTVNKIPVSEFLTDTYVEKGVHGKDSTTWKVKDSIKSNYANVKYYLINSSGSITKNKSNAKDSDDYKFDVNSYIIQSITLED